MHRIVHLDLKGAPLQVPYLEKVLLSAKQWGATGVLLEWEDTFPYSGQLVDIGSQSNSGGDGLYSIQEVQHILQFAEENGLKAIQLIQTIGHMEFVLKHPSFRALREAPRSPAVLCPSRAPAQQLVRAMLDQALLVQPGARYLHIGADEVWHTAICEDCQRRAAASEYKAASLYLEHIRDLALYLKTKRPDLTVLMWDDMLRSCSPDTLNAYQLGALVQPVVWNYSAASCFYIEPALWHSYRLVFRALWAGSAFKGANGSSQILSPVSRYTSNHQAWCREIKNYGSVVNFAGIILTGWSRYDHYATLCELLPTSLNSLASCLRMLTEPDNSSECVVSAASHVSCADERVARAVHSLVALRERCLAFTHGDLIATWLNPWQLANNFTNPIQIEGIVITAQQLLSELTALQMELTAHLRVITGKRSTEEWIATFITPLWNRLTEIHITAEARWKADASVLPYAES